MYANNSGNNEVHGEYEIVWDKQKGPIEGKLLYTKTLFDLDKKDGNDFKGIGKTDMTTVVHEMRHQYDHEIGNTGDFLPGNNEKDPAEIRAVYLENKARDIEGLKHRTKYGDVIDPKKLKNPPNNKMPE